MNVFQEFPKNDKFRVQYNYLPHGDGEPPLFYGLQGSTKSNAYFLLDKVGTHGVSNVFQDQNASRNQQFFFSTGWIFFFRNFSVSLQHHLQCIFKIFSSFFQSFSLSVYARNFLNPSCPPTPIFFKSGCQFHILILAVFLPFVQSLQAASIVQKPLDEFVIYEVPTAWKAGNTTILFPSEISALYGKDISPQEQPNVKFLISFVPGNYYVTLRALEKAAEDYLTVIYNRKAYIFHLVACDAPFRTLTLFNSYKNRIAQNTSPSAPQLLSLLDKTKAYSLFKTQHPDALEGVQHISSSIENTYKDFSIRIKNIWRFETQDTLVFKLELINHTNSSIPYKKQNLAIQLGNKHYPTSLVDASGSIPPNSTTVAFLAITGDGTGGRNNLAPDNNWIISILKDQKLASAK